MSWIIIAFAALSILFGGGTILAADQAVPGDGLYALDLSLEEMRLSMANSPEEIFALQLDFADERLKEAQKLAANGMDTDLGQSIKRYRESISSAAGIVSDSENELTAVFEETLEAALAEHSQVLTGLNDEDVSSGESEDPGDGEKGETNRCENRTTHPMAERLAEEYGVAPEALMELFCQGYGWGEIVLAYDMSALSGLSVEELLAFRAEGMGWGQIKKLAGIKGSPHGPVDKDKPGKPEHPPKSEKPPKPEKPDKAP